MTIFEAKILLSPSSMAGPIGEWHDDFHTAFDKVIKELKEEKNLDKIKNLRIKASDIISQLKIGADLLNGSGDQHWIESVTLLNRYLPEDQKIYIPPSQTNIPQG